MRPVEDSDQPVYLPSLIRVFAGRLMGSQDPSFLKADSKHSDQTGQMPLSLQPFVASFN